MASQEQAVCGLCGLVQRVAEVPPGFVARCARCETVIGAHRRPDALNHTAAYALTALLLYLPANLLPIISMDYLGIRTSNTIWSGCVELFDDGKWQIALVVFLASILIPLLKLSGLLVLVLSIDTRRWPRARSGVYQFIDRIGRWSMLDVFLLSIVVVLIKFGDWGTVLPGPGVTAFAGVVVFSMLAAASFDSHLIWEH